MIIARFYRLSDAVEFINENYGGQFIIGEDLACGTKPYTLVSDESDCIGMSGRVKRSGFYTVDQFVERLCTPVRYEGKVLTAAHFQKDHEGLDLFGTPCPEKVERDRQRKLNDPDYHRAQIEKSREYNVFYSDEIKDYMNSYNKEYREQNHEELLRKQRLYGSKRNKLVFERDGERKSWSTLKAQYSGFPAAEADGWVRVRI